MKVPFNDLGQQHRFLKNEIEESFKKIIESSSFVRGEEVFTFEKKFAEINNSKNCISCANGTDALYIAMRALNVKNGDEVIVPAHSWISTSETVTQAGGKIIFCDCCVHVRLFCPLFGFLSKPHCSSSNSNPFN